MGFQLRDGHFQGLEPIDAKPGDHKPMDFFAGSEWDYVRKNSVKASKMMRGHGPFMPAILGAEEMEYTSRPEVLKQLTRRFEKNE